MTIPKGWKLVPEVATEAMVEAAYDPDAYCDYGGIYTAMLAAAPEPPQAAAPIGSSDLKLYPQGPSHERSAVNTCDWITVYEHDDPMDATYFNSGCAQEDGRAHEWMGDEDGDSAARWMKFCPFCGKPTKFIALGATPTEGVSE